VLGRYGAADQGIPTEDVERAALMLYTQATIQLVEAHGWLIRAAEASRRNRSP
jgi:hypothetical protein